MRGHYYWSRPALWTGTGRRRRVNPAKNRGLPDLERAENSSHTTHACIYTRSMAGPASARVRPSVRPPLDLAQRSGAVPHRCMHARNPSQVASQQTHGRIFNIIMSRPAQPPSRPAPLLYIRHRPARLLLRPRHPPALLSPSTSPVAAPCGDRGGGAGHTRTRAGWLSIGRRARGCASRTAGGDRRE